MNNVAQQYFKSSSFKMALLFTVLLSVSASILLYLLHDFGAQSFIQSATQPEVQKLILNYKQLRQFSLIIMALMLLVVLVSFGISYFVVTRINRISTIAQQMMETGDLSKRMSIDTQWDDLSNLSHVLNVFLDRTETLMTGVREVSNNIAHDLRTPLTELRNTIESLKTKKVEEAHLEIVLSHIDRILAIFNSILRISNIENALRSAFLKVDLNKVVVDVVELYEPLAEEKRISIALHLQPSLFTMGDENLLFQLFANLLDNAIKFSNEGSQIILEGKTKGSIIELSIADSGQGIPNEEKEKVFKHFYRSDASRAKPGNGLGLSLVKAIIDQHRATIALEDNNPGLIVKITMNPYQ